jgi:hypothetical protein
VSAEIGTHSVGVHHFDDGCRDLVAVLEDEQFRRLAEQPADLVAGLAKRFRGAA